MKRLSVGSRLHRSAFRNSQTAAVQFRPAVAAASVDSAVSVTHLSNGNSPCVRDWFKMDLAPEKKRQENGAPPTKVPRGGEEDAAVSRESSGSKNRRRHKKGGNKKNMGRQQVSKELQPENGEAQVETSKSDEVAAAKKSKGKKPAGENKESQQQRNRKRSGGGKEKVRPNMFIALQVSNPEIHSQIKRFQEHALAAAGDAPEGSIDPGHVVQTLVPARKGHISLQVFHTDALDKVMGVMRSVAETMDGRPMTLGFEGTGSFSSDRVVYASLAEGADEVRALWERLQAGLTEAGIEVGGSAKTKASFTPHMTIMKTSKAKTAAAKRMRLSKELYSDLADLKFGTQVCSSLQLLSMTEPQAEDGYYKRLGEISFSEVAPDEATDHSHCCKPVKVRTKRPRANVFLALPINSRMIHTAARSFHTHVVANNPDLFDVCVPVSLAHLSLQVFNVDEDKHKEVVDAVKKVAADMGDKPIEVSIRGLRSFGTRVVYAGLDNAGRSRVMDLWKLLQAELTSRKIANGGLSDRCYEPHMTLLKTSLAQSPEARERPLDTAAFESLSELEFGVETVSKIQLLSMKTPYAEDGYYHRIAEIPFAETSNGDQETEDHADCCRPLEKPSEQHSPKNLSLRVAAVAISVAVAVCAVIAITLVKKRN